MRGVSGRVLSATLTVAIVSEVKLHSNANVSARERHLVLDEKRVVVGPGMVKHCNEGATGSVSFVFPAENMKFALQL